MVRLPPEVVNAKGRALTTYVCDFRHLFVLGQMHHLEWSDHYRAR